MTWPFENDTSAITNKLAKRSMKTDKRSKAFLLLTIALSVCMIFSIILISAGAQEEFKNTQRSKAQIAILGITDDQLGTYNPTDLMERSPVVPGRPYFMMTYDMAKNLTGITEQTGILAITVTPNHFDEVLSAVQEIAEQNGKISVNTIEQTIKNIEYRYSSSIKALYMAAAILFTFGGISLMNMLMVDFQNRKREFGLLEAVGATQKQLKAMLSREIGIYLGGSLTVSLVLGTIISIIACQRLEAVNHCITLNLPWLFLIALIAAMVVIYMIFTAYAKAELRKTGILSAIREE